MELKKNQMAWSAGPENNLFNYDSILDLINIQMEKKQNSLAVVSGDNTITYKELDFLSEQIAEKLLKKSIGKNQLVPIISDGGITYIISILAVMRCGAAFVPVDIKWPEERLISILAELESNIVITDDKGASSTFLYENLDCITVDLDFDISLLGKKSSKKIKIASDDLIYGFYTSGSTGKPKCCLNKHKGLLNRMLHMTKVFDVASNEGVLQNSRHVFDSSLWQIFWPLTFGGYVVIPERRSITDFNSTLETMSSKGVVATDFVPSIFNLLVQFLILNPEKTKLLSSLKYLLLGGEEINTYWVKKFNSLVPHVKIVNTYGPTEASIGMVFNMKIEKDFDTGSITLGKPISNTHLVILNSDQQACSLEEVGEIAIGGYCLGGGYLKASKNNFCKNPVKSLPGDSLYLTGDMGHLDKNKVLHFKERKDYQVKINGERIEIGEIESVMMEMDHIDEIKVIEVTDINEHKELVGFVCSKISVDEKKIKLDLEKKIPKSHIPSQFIQLESIPLTYNGKADRVKLKEKYTEKVASFGRKESNLNLNFIVEAFQAILCRNIGPDDSFFENGGDSIKAFNLMMLFDKKYNIQVEIKQLYEAPTPSKLLNLLNYSACNALVRENSSEMKKEQESILDMLNNNLCSSFMTKSYTKVVLTGATGYLGSHILYHLVKGSDLKVYCIVRAQDEFEAFERILNTLKKYDLELSEENYRNITVVIGDLSDDNLGMSEKKLHKLLMYSKAVIHCGADVDFLKSYPLLKQTNVLSTCTLIENLVKVNPHATFNLISTTSIVNNDLDEMPDENFVPKTELIKGNYSRSKAMSELSVLEAKKYGLNTRIYRVGEIFPSVLTGCWNSKSIFYHLIQAILCLKEYPSTNISLDYTAIDPLASLISKASIDNSKDVFTIHSFNNYRISLHGLVKYMEKLYGRFAKVSYKDFITRVRSESVVNNSPEYLKSVAAVLPFNEGEPEMALAKKFKEMFMDSNQIVDKTELSYNVEAKYEISWPYPSYQNIEPSIIEMEEENRVDIEETLEN